MSLGRAGGLGPQGEAKSAEPQVPGVVQRWAWGKDLQDCLRNTPWLSYPGVLPLAQPGKDERIPIVSAKRPFASAAQLEAMAAQYPTPFYLYDERGIRANAQRLVDAFAWNPGFREYFAVKATPNPALIAILRDYGFGLDCSSECELLLAEAMGIGGEDVMFSSNDTPDGEFEHALRLGATINLDDLTHVDALAVAARRVGQEMPRTVSLRFNPGGDFAFANGIFGSPEEAKFGLTEPQVLQAARDLRDLGVEHLGLHALLASNTLSNDYFPTLARTLFALAVRVEREVGIDVSLVNLSGGVGIGYRPEDPDNDIDLIGQGVRRAFEEVLVPAGMGDVRMACELGRFMMGPYGALVTRVIHTKDTYHHYLGVDACAANLMRPMLYGAYHHITVMGKEDQPADHTYDVVGMLCENSDRLADDRALPQVQVGDLLFVHDTGAHGHSMGYNYNGRLRSAELLLREDGSVDLIRRAETPADYFATLDVLPVHDRLPKRKAGRP